MLLAVVPWEGQCKVILIVNLAIAIVPAERRAGTENIVLMIDTECQDQCIKGMVLMSLLKHHGLSVVLLEACFLEQLMPC